MQGGDSKLESLGKHILMEIYDCDRSILDSHERCEELMVKAAEKAHAHIIKSVFHKFNPYGVSGVVVISESHLAIHTWPEYGYAAVDVFTCGEEIDPYVAYDFIKKAFKPKHVEIKEIKRGVLDIPGMTHKPQLKVVGK
jgi:S-adenosylmethionine decarboxylase